MASSRELTSDQDSAINNSIKSSWRAVENNVNGNIVNGDKANKSLLKINEQIWQQYGELDDKDKDGFLFALSIDRINKPGLDEPDTVINIGLTKNKLLIENYAFVPSYEFAYLFTLPLFVDQSETDQPTPISITYENEYIHIKLWSDTQVTLKATHEGIVIDVWELDFDGNPVFVAETGYALMSDLDDDLEDQLEYELALNQCR